MSEIHRIEADDDRTQSRNSGVGALFNADLHTYDPDYAPREDWIIGSDGNIQHVPFKTMDELYQQREISSKYDYLKLLLRGVLEN